MAEKTRNPQYIARDALNSRRDQGMLSAFEMKELIIPEFEKYYKDIFTHANGIIMAESPKNEEVQKYSKVYIYALSYLTSTAIHLLDKISKTEMSENYWTYNKNSCRFLVTNHTGPRLLGSIRRMKLPMGLVYYDSKQRKYKVDYREAKGENKNEA